jgi:ABC-type multidrug transport system fused ATPase/permease subunit
MIVEENSIAVFLQKSTKNYASFVLQIIMTFTISILMLISLLIGNISVYNYLLSVICYYLILYHANEFLLAFLDLQSIQSKQQFVNFDTKNIPSVSNLNLLYNSNQIESISDEGLSIDFKDVVVKICGKKFLSIHKLKIERKDIIGLTGNGAQLIAAVLFKLLKPSTGMISIENQELSILNQDSLIKLIAVVPHNLQIQNISIT